MDDDEDGCRSFMVNAVTEHHTSTMSEEIDVPVISSDDNDDVMIDKDFRLFRDHLSDDNNVLPPFEDDNGESETRTLNFNMVSGDANRSKLGGTEKPISDRVSQHGRKKTLAKTLESIQRDNGVAERIKRKIDELEATRSVPLVRKQVNTSESTDDESLWDVPLYRTLEVIKRDNEARKLAESMVNDTSRDVPLVRAQEAIQRDNNKAKKMSELTNVDTLWDIPLVRAQEAIQRDNNKAKKMSELTNVDTLWDIPLVRAQEVIQRDNKARKFIESKVNTLRDVPLVRTKEVIQRDNKISETRKKISGETMATETSKALPVKRLNRATEPKAVEETQSYQGVCVGTRKKNVEESVVDKDYMSYLTWLVDSFKHSTTVPEKDLLPKVKVELESWSDDNDDDIIEVSDSPFTDGESTPFVVSKNKNVIDLEKDDSTEEESGSCVFRKELMDVLEKPYDEGELWLLSGQVSVKKRVSRCRELRKGRERSYETSELGLSYLEKVSDFDKEYKLVDGDDKARLELLRGFFFYLENISLAGAFKPWLPENRKKLGQRKQCLLP